MAGIGGGEAAATAERVLTLPADVASERTYGRIPTESNNAATERPRKESYWFGTLSRGAPSASVVWRAR